MLSESTPNSEERERLIAVVARTFAGWNEDTEDGDLTAHWEKVNATCLREAAKIVDAVLAAGYRPLLATSAGVTRMLVTDLRNVEAHDRADQLAHRAADLIESLTAQLAASNVNLSREMRARDGLQAKLDDTIAALATTGGETAEKVNGLNVHDWQKIATAKDEANAAAVAAIDELADAIRLTVEYVGNDTLPPIEGWSWFDALMKYRPELAEEFERNPILLYAKHLGVPVDPTSPETTEGQS